METKYDIGPLSRDDVDTIMGAMEYVTISAHGGYIKGVSHIEDGDIHVSGYLNCDKDSDMVITVPSTFKATDIAIWLDTMFSVTVG